MRRFKKNLLLTFTGFQEATFAIADRVNKKVREVKNAIEASELEREIQNNQAALGAKVCQQADLSLPLLSKSPELKSLHDKIREDQKKLASMERHAPPHDSLIDFERTLIQADLFLHDVMILEGYKGIGKKIKELALPLGMHIVLIQKGDQVHVANGEMVIETHDQITFICEKVNAVKCISYLM